MARVEEIRQAGKYDEYSQRARGMRDMTPGGGRANVDKQGRVVGESTHKMRTEKIDDRYVAFPTLFPHKEKSGRWIDYSGGQDPKLLGKGSDVRGAYDEARSRGEVFEFGQDEKEADKFAKGSWKPK